MGRHWSAKADAGCSQGKSQPIGQLSWHSHLSYVDGVIEVILEDELDPTLVQDVMRLNQGHGLDQRETVSLSNSGRQYLFPLDGPQSRVHSTSQAFSTATLVSTRPNSPKKGLA